MTRGGAPLDLINTRSDTVRFEGATVCSLPYAGTVFYLHLPRGLCVQYSWRGGFTAQAFSDLKRGQAFLLEE
jgi:hypothetical protein